MVRKKEKFTLYRANLGNSLPAVVITASNLDSFQREMNGFIQNQAINGC